MSLLDEYNKFKETVDLDATTIMLFEDCINVIEYDMDAPLPDGVLEDTKFHELLLSNCYNYQFDWDVGYNYEDALMIAEDTIKEYNRGGEIEIN